MGFLSGLGKVLKFAAPVAASFIPGVGPLVGGAMAASGAKNIGGKVLTGIMNSGTLDTIGRSAGAAAETAASNRGTELDAMLEADRSEALIRRDRRDEESDLWKKMQATDYMMSGGVEKKPVQTAFGQATDFGIGPKPISAGNRAMAATLNKQLQHKLANPMKARDYNSKMKPGTGEKVLNWLGPIASIGSQVMSGRENRPGDVITNILKPTLDVSQNYRPRMDGSRVPTADSNSDWLVEGMPGQGKPTPSTFRF